MSTIALIVESSSGGTGRHVADLARQLLRRGHSVHLLYGVARSDARFRSAVEALIRNPGFEARAFDIRHGISVFDCSAIVNIIHYLRSEGPFDVVHAHSTKAGLLGRIAAWIVGVRVVYTPHCVMSMNPSFSHATRKAAAMLERMLAHVSSRIIAVSSAERIHMLQCGLTSRSIQLIPNGVGLPDSTRRVEDRRRVREHFGLAEHEICIGFVGRLVREKNLELLLTSFNRLLKSSRYVRLVIVGDGPLREQLEKFARTCGIESRVTWCGYVDAKPLFSGFDLFALPSAIESWPYVIMEAMAAGLPVVATDVGGIPELIRSGDTGYVVPNGDATLFAEALVRLTADSALRQSMGANALRTIRQFSIESMATQIEQVYFGQSSGCDSLSELRTQEIAFDPSVSANDICASHTQAFLRDVRV